MRKADAVRKLAALGYVIDWSVTGHSEGYWSGTIDAAGRCCIDSDCRGEVVHGGTAAEWYRNAVAAAESYGKPTPCPHPVGRCEFHDE